MAKAYLLTSPPRTVIFNTSPDTWDAFRELVFLAFFFFLLCVHLCSFLLTCILFLLNDLAPLAPVVIPGS